MIPSKTPKDNSSQPDGSSLGLPARKASPSGQRSKSSPETGSGLSAHVPKPPAHEPMLSDASIMDMWYFGDSNDVKNRPTEEGEELLVDDAYEWGGRDVRDFYEGLIASGELRAVKEVKQRPSVEDIMEVVEMLRDAEAGFASSEKGPEKSYVLDMYNACKNGADSLSKLITSGELRVVKKAKLGNAMSPWCCYFCSHYLGNVSDPKFCPNCGSEILPL